MVGQAEEEDALRCVAGVSIEAVERAPAWRAILSELGWTQVFLHHGCYQIDLAAAEAEATQYQARGLGASLSVSEEADAAGSVRRARLGLRDVVEERG